MSDTRIQGVLTKALPLVRGAYGPTTRHRPLMNQTSPSTIVAYSLIVSLLLALAIFGPANCGTSTVIPAQPVSD
jgi:hypothetical protein